MKQAEVYMHDILAGILTEDEEGYHFQYNASYLASNTSEAISLTLPLRQEQYHNTVLFPFFDGLIPEGWLLQIARKNWKIDQRDRMGLLMTTCYSCIGAVSIRPVAGDQ